MNINQYLEKVYCTISAYEHYVNKRLLSYSGSLRLFREQNSFIIKIK